MRRLLFLIIEGQGRIHDLKGLQRRSDFSPENRIATTFQLHSKQVERFTLLLVPSNQKSIQKAKS